MVTHQLEWENLPGNTVGWDSGDLECKPGSEVAYWGSRDRHHSIVFRKVGCSIRQACIPRPAMPHMSYVSLGEPQCSTLNIEDNNITPVEMG